MTSVSIITEQDLIKGDIDYVLSTASSTDVNWGRVTANTVALRLKVSGASDKPECEFTFVLFYCSLSTLVYAIEINGFYCSIKLTLVVFVRCAVFCIENDFTSVFNEDRFLKGDARPFLYLTTTGK